METLLRDARYGFRTLFKNRGFTAVAIVALALGIGANTAIFSVVNAVLLRPLAFENSDQLVMVWEKRMHLGRIRNSVSAPDFDDWRAQNNVFEDMAAYIGQGFNLATSGEPERIQGAGVSPSLFSILRAQPRLGRFFDPDEDKPNSNPVVIISSGLWQRSFGSDPEIAGKTVRLNDKAYTIVGVTPAGFIFPNRRAEAWVPLTLSPEDAGNRAGHMLTVVARLKSGVTLQEARTEMDSIAAQLEQQYPTPNTGHGANVFSLYEEVVTSARPALLLLLGAAAFVLLIACANVANLLFARSAARSREIAIRTALGARRSRIVRQLLTESVLLALAGGIIGVLVALWGLDLLLAIGEGSIPRAKEIKLDGWALGFSLLVSIATGMIFGLVPALQASKPDMNEALKEGSRSASGSIRRNKTRSLFVIAEVAICLVLLIGAGLMIKSFSKLINISPGFNPENVLAVNVALSGSQYRDAAAISGFYQQALERLSSVPGVQSAAGVTALPMAGSFGGRYFSIEGRPPQPAGQGFNARTNVATPGYFETMNIPLIEGRDFDNRDARGASDVVILNQEAVRRFWPDESPIGQRINVDNRNRTVVGVVGDVKQSGLDADTTPEMFWPYNQVPVPFGTLVLRTTGEPSEMTSAVRSAMQEIDRDLPLYGIKTVNDVISDSVAPRRLNMLLLGIFAGLAIVLAAVGIYGVISYSVSQRTREIGIRMALGASHSSVLRLVVGEGMILAVIGVATGLVASFFLTRLMSTLLFGVSTTDPVTFVAISLLLTTVSIVASLIPARRAIKVDPMVALRYE
ncbi:MAG TPA: ABC transporter permease [Blastocatellia bacterium]|nr:ABC transporter permease [Blastocatellia bacterium]